MLDKLMEKLGWYMENPEPEKTVGGKLDQYEPMTEEEIKLFSTKQNFDSGRICK